MKLGRFALLTLAVLSVICLVGIAISDEISDERWQKNFQRQFQKQVQPQNAVFLTEEDAGKTITVTSGDVVVIALLCDGIFQGYQWTPSGDLGQACELAGCKKAVHYSTSVGWRGVLTLNTKNTGASVISLQQQNLPNTDVLDRTFKVTLNVVNP